MSQGSMSSDANYPSNSGIPLDGVQLLGKFSYPRRLVAMTVEGTPGTSATYKAQALLRDDDNSSGTWVDIKSASFTGNGAAATGNLVFEAIGEAVRINAVNGTSPGTGANVPKYSLNVYEPADQIPQVL